MSDPSDALTEDDVDQIVTLIGALDKSNFDYLQLECGNLKVTVSKGVLPPGTYAIPERPDAAPVAGAPIAAPQSSPATGKSAAIEVEGTEAILAPMMGRFYSAPEPGTPPFVSIGQKVSPDTTVALIEVMKVFTAVPAGISGVITDICVKDSDFVEYQDVIFRVRPD